MLKIAVKVASGGTDNPFRHSANIELITCIILEAAMLVLPLAVSGHGVYFVY
jgi:hypothetical protein